MRLVRYRFGDRIATGVLEGETVRTLRGTFFEDPVFTGDEVPAADFRLLAPVLPSKVVGDLQAEDGQWTRAKGFDGSCPLGPWIETELESEDLGLETRVNGETRQHARTSEMAFDVPALIAHITSFMTLLPGDVLLTGTPAGIGQLTPGDKVEVEIEGIGALANQAVEG